MRTGLRLSIRVDDLAIAILAYAVDLRLGSRLFCLPCPASSGDDDPQYDLLRLNVR